MKKEEAYSRLFSLEQSGEDITPYLKMLAVSESVPEEVLSFIANGGSERNVSFLENLKEKKFYRNIMDESLPPLEQAKALSSLVTHTLIECGNTEEPIETLSSSLGLAGVMNALSSYMNGDEEKVKESCRSIRQILKRM